MTWKRYQNELIVITTFLLMVTMYLYKQHASTSQLGARDSAAQVMGEIKEVVALKKVWADKKIDKKVESLRTVIPASKVKWSKKSKKVTATYKNLRPSELNKLSSRILNTPVIIEKLLIKKTANSYSLEFKCRW